MILAILIVMWTLCALLMYRNARVFQYRTELNHRISDLAQDDITSSLPWEWRYEEFNKVDYNSMLYKFWKPFDSFYTDRRFMEPPVIPKKVITQKRGKPDGQLAKRTKPKSGSNTQVKRPGHLQKDGAKGRKTPKATPSPRPAKVDRVRRPRK